MNPDISEAVEFKLYEQYEFPDAKLLQPKKRKQPSRAPKLQKLRRRKAAGFHK